MRLARKVFADGIYTIPQFNPEYYLDPQNFPVRRWLYKSGVLTNPADKKDKAFIAQGGGPTAVVKVGAALCVLTQARLDHIFKLFAGSSAGALVEYSYASGTIEEIPSVLKYMSESLDTSIKMKIRTAYEIEFGKKTTNRPFPLYEIINTLASNKIYIEEKILKHASDFYVTTTNIDDASANIHNAKKVIREEGMYTFLDILGGSANYPILSGDRFSYRNRELLDGGMSLPIPFIVALNLGYSWDQIQTICTDSEKYERGQLNWIAKRLLGKTYGFDSDIYHLLNNLPHTHNNALKTLVQKAIEGKTSVMFSDENLKVTLETTDFDELMEGYRYCRLKYIQSLLMSGRKLPQFLMKEYYQGSGEFIDLENTSRNHSDLRPHSVRLAFSQ